MPPTKTNGTGQNWLWMGRRISTVDGEYPRLVAAAILAYRDAWIGPDLDTAEVLVWTVEEHPPWNGNCPACGTAGACDAQRRGDVVALEYLIKKSTELIRYGEPRPLRSALHVVPAEPEGA